MEDRLLTDQEKMGIINLITSDVNDEFQKNYARKKQKIQKKTNIFRKAYERVLQLFKR